MTSIRYPNDHSTPMETFLKSIGINILTGEACGIGMRLLCDLNEDGVYLYTQFTGGASPQQSNWNSKVNFKDEDGVYQSTPAVKSLMLTRPVLRDIVVFKLCQSYPVVEDNVGKDDHGLYIDSIHCFDNIEDAREHGAKYDYIYNQPTVKSRRYWNMSTSPSNGLRNTHEMSGRVD